MTRRRSLSRKQRVEIFDRHSGLCGICGVKIKVGEAWEADHAIPRALTGKDDLAEFRPVHVDCHAGKSRDDNRIAKKATRVRAKHLGVKKAGKPMMGSHASGWKRKIDGTTERRQ